MIRKSVYVLAVLVLFCVWCGEASGDDLKDRPDKPPAKGATYKGPKVELKVRFTPGDYVLTEKMTIPMKMKINVGGRTQAMNMTMAMTVGGEVGISKPNSTGEQNVRFVCRTIKTDMSMLGMKMKYHSDGPEDKQTPQLAEALKPLVGVSLTLTGKDGKWKNVSEVLNTVMAKIGNAQMRQQMKGTWGPFLREMLTKHWAKMIPPKPVGPGDEWKSTMSVSSVPMLGGMGFVANCRLRDIRSTAQGKVAIIDYVVKAKVADKEVTPGPDGPPVKMKIKTMTIYMTGSAEFNMDIGLGTRIDLKQDLSAGMSAAQGAMNMTMDLEADASYTNTLVKAKAAGNQVAPPK